MLEKISRRDNPQTVIGVFEQRLTPAGAIRPRPDAVWVALETVRDPGNLGTIIRTIDAVGAAGVILVGETVDPFSIEAVRATMGSIFHVPLARANRPSFDAHAALARARSSARISPARPTIAACRYRAPVLLVMGNEQSGPAPDVAAALRRSWSRSRWRAGPTPSTSPSRPA